MMVRVMVLVVVVMMLVVSIFMLVFMFVRIRDIEICVQCVSYANSFDYYLHS